MSCIPHKAEKLQMFSARLFKCKEFQQLSGRDPGNEHLALQCILKLDEKIKSHPEIITVETHISWLAKREKEILSLQLSVFMRCDWVKPCRLCFHHQRLSTVNHFLIRGQKQSNIYLRGQRKNQSLELSMW